MNSSTGFGTMLKNGLHEEAPVKWTAYLPQAWTPTEYRLHADSMFLPNPTGQSWFVAQNRDLGHPAFAVSLQSQSVRDAKKGHPSGGWPFL
jgi:hypothetical protein